MSDKTSAKKAAVPAKPTTKHKHQRRARAAHTPVPYLPSYHDKICDAVADLLTTGGHDQDVTDLVRLSIRHHHRRSLADLTDTELQKSLESALSNGIPRYKQCLEAGWKQRRAQPDDAIEPKTVTDRLRANSRDQLEQQFEVFLRSAGPEEMRFMLAVMDDRNQENSFYSSCWPEAEIAIATIFEHHSSDSDWFSKTVFVRVPEKLLGKVRKYTEALAAVEGVLE